MESISGALLLDGGISRREGLRLGLGVERGTGPQTGGDEGIWQELVGTEVVVVECSMVPRGSGRPGCWDPVPGGLWTRPGTDSHSSRPGSQPRGLGKQGPSAKAGRDRLQGFPLGRVGLGQRAQGLQDNWRPGCGQEGRRTCSSTGGHASPSFTVVSW